MNISFDLNNFVSSLQYVWQGMLAIFIVIGVIIGATVLLNFICRKITARIAAKKNQQP